MAENYPSMFNKWPTEDEPDNIYQFGSFVLMQGQDLTLIDRHTYSGLEWLGDVGGLFGALQAIGLLLVGPISAFNLKA